MPHTARRRLRLERHGRQVLLDFIAPAHLLELLIQVHALEALIIENISVVGIHARTLLKL